MPFQMRDETASLNLFYIDNSGNLGLGSLPVAGKSLTVQGTSIINNFGGFSDSMFVPGSQASVAGALSIPAGGSITVSVAAGDLPTVTASLPPSQVTGTNVTFTNPNTSAELVQYALW
jgi:hypothetical protein